jgi:NAD(P)-dependent dehydrogenase (short-subunit alcohol dehydrogenase family)
MGIRLLDKVVVITGGTKGIGKGIALMAASEGALVVISGRNEQDGQQVIQEIKEKHHTGALFVKGDISKEEACKTLIDAAVGHFGHINGLVNNAGIFPRAPITETTEELFDSIIAVNLKGSFFCSKYAIQAMMKSGGGSIVHMGSTHGYKGGLQLAAYACSKGAVLTLNRHIAAHYASKSIRSNWVTVGWVATEGELELHASLGTDKDQLLEMAYAKVPTGRMQTPEDMAFGVIYLLSDESSQVIGSELAISGGLI